MKWFRGYFFKKYPRNTCKLHKLQTIDLYIEPAGMLQPSSHTHNKKSGIAALFYLLQVQNTVLDLLGTALVPVLGADIATGTSCDVHLGLISIAALGAAPNQLAVVVLDLNLTVKTTDLTVVGLGVQLSVHDVVVDVLHDLQNSIDILLHVGHFHIADGTAGGKLLELCLKGQLGESVNGCGNMDMVRVGDIALVGDAGNHTEAGLQALGKLIGGRLQRRAVQREVDVVFLSPLKAYIIHVLHNRQLKWIVFLNGV